MKAIENVFQGTGGQIDLLNTLYGGSTQTTMNVEREDEQSVDYPFGSGRESQFI